MANCAPGYQNVANGAFRGIIRFSFRDLEHFLDCMEHIQWSGRSVHDKSYESSILENELNMKHARLVFDTGEVVLYDAAN